jgi:uncharacterized membrane protein YbaN (DUF454 family)
MGRVRSFAGKALVAVGIAGTVLPVLPGIPFLIAGIALLGTDHPISRAVVDRIRLRRRAPRKESP